ncbi:unnamed protein product [Thelazia callipaeda]|uniref:Arrestin_C domain-containing protein n=1 Tax=Thelazia callipaeda TaxID=103827 RepID=A0A0N5D7S9_THECL|nr:unnamed protein product [Thelazia callipaeda]
MANFTKFDIEFDNAESVYFAGQEVTGKVVIESCEPNKVSEILLELKGRAKTYWTKDSGKSRKHCSQAEPYFCEQFNTGYTHQFTQKTPDNKKQRILPFGKHEIPFSYTLPKTLPTSFEGEFGYVRYTCKATCERPWDVDIVSKRAFTVIGIEDINQNSKAMEPASESECISSVKLCCQKQGSVSVEMSVNRTGFTPGEEIHVNTLINNDSAKTIRCLALKMKQFVDYRAKTFSGTEEVKQASKVVIKKEKGEIAAHSKSAWTNEIITVPSIPPRLSRCKIIQISYVLETNVNGKVATVIPIQIGTIPCLSNITERNKNGEYDLTVRNGNIPSAESIKLLDEKITKIQVTITSENGKTIESSNELDDLNLITSEPTSLLKKRVRMPSSIVSELYPKLPSPYYRISHFGEVNIFEDQENVQYGDIKFAPKYPFY